MIEHTENFVLVYLTNALKRCLCPLISLKITKDSCQPSCLRRLRSQTLLPVVGHQCRPRLAVLRVPATVDDQLRDVRSVAQITVGAVGSLAENEGEGGGAAERKRQESHGATVHPSLQGGGECGKSDLWHSIPTVRIGIRVKKKNRGK